MNATVSTRKRAWQLADKLFPTDYMKDERDSLRAGYPVFNTTSTDDKYTSQNEGRKQHGSSYKRKEKPEQPD